MDLAKIVVLVVLEAVDDKEEHKTVDTNVLVEAVREKKKDEHYYMVVFYVAFVKPKSLELGVASAHIYLTVW
eukprot:CAMPEP_0197346968 /NCGR_PEP_ID=MMETSP0893-20130614/6691_1 /TAXON_ID=44058 ORGANISM="Aureoumbra lagunensis, Strain CCMP1510" /NCGR_SAMPLE_ID=MMETSP0893 /ASSEMBLY_ACC=CAM_ASM_000539 /LENGTH=71 /DNA_ID=CAMNT_0042856463 /DNA_START=865 /DNA_END=1080 /DNA_ORIENTATION=-